MNPILERYRRVGQDARDSWAMLEAVQNGPFITFRSGRSCARVIGLLAMIVIVGMVVSCAFGVSQWLPSPWNWLVGGLLLTPLAWVVAQARTMTMQRKWFEIDTVQEEILIYPAPQPAVGGAGCEAPTHRVQIAGIDFFFAQEIGWGDSSDTAMYSALRDGSVVELVRSLGTFLTTAERNAKLLGQLCERPAYSLGCKVPPEALVTGTYRPPWRDSEGRWGINTLNHGKVQQNAVTLYTPEEHLN
jgi:hypothetical protein